MSILASSDNIPSNRWASANPWMLSNPCSTPLLLMKQGVFLDQPSVVVWTYLWVISSLQTMILLQDNDKVLLRLGPKVIESPSNYTKAQLTEYGYHIGMTWNIHYIIINVEHTRHQ